MLFEGLEMRLRTSRKVHTCSEAILTGDSGGPAGDGTIVVSGCGAPIPEKTLYAVQFTWEYEDIGPFYGKLCMECAVYTGAVDGSRDVLQACSARGVDSEAFLMWVIAQGKTNQKDVAALLDQFVAETPSGGSQ